MRDREPSIDGPALRQYVDSTYQPLCESLKDIRAGIDELDAQIIELLAKRAMLVKDAARFKENSFQVAAPARQAQVFAKARAMAQKCNPGFTGFEDVVEASYRTLVAQFIAAEQRYFQTALVKIQHVSAIHSQDKSINQ